MQSDAEGRTKRNWSRSDGHLAARHAPRTWRSGTGDDLLRRLHPVLHPESGRGIQSGDSDLRRPPGGAAPAHQAPRPWMRRTWRHLTERDRRCSDLVPPRARGNEAYFGDGRRGLPCRAAHSTMPSSATGGIDAHADPVESEGGTSAGGTSLAGLDGQAHRGCSVHVSTSRQRIAELARHAARDGGGHRLASCDQRSTRRRVAKPFCRGAGCGRTRTSGSDPGPGSATTLVYPTAKGTCVSSWASTSTTTSASETTRDSTTSSCNDRHRR